MRLTPCPSCDRHVDVAARTCPFCDVALPGSPLGVRGRAVALVGAAAITTLTACPRVKYGGPPLPEPRESSEPAPVEQPDEPAPGESAPDEPAPDLDETVPS